MADDVTLRAVGDIMTGFSLSWRYLTEPPETFAAHRLVHSDSCLVHPSLRSDLRNADLTIGNLEAVISDSFALPYDEPPPPIMSPPETADFLADSGFDVVHIDNNHILDHGEGLLAETKARLDEAGIEYVGSPLGREQPKTFSCNGHDVHVAGFNLCSGDESSDPEEILTTAEDIAARDGFSVLSIHWGSGFEHTLRPSPAQISLANDLASMGVDAVLGHHSHTFQPVELRHGTAVAYSLGNFVFDMWREANVESGVLEFGLASGSDPRVAVRTTRNDGATVEPYDVPRIRAQVPTDVDLVSPDEYDREAKAARTNHRREVLKAYASNTFQFPLRFHARTVKWWAHKVVRELRSSNPLDSTGQ
ncbi:CapA family protein [Halorussus halophilus]|uniref:CapA family protein n=1 Tax=Halorussus halophilus TaxID=2650975 RepID=UPI0013010FE2|nr:CapA family protein [Halorussus halophilus]